MIDIIDIPLIALFSLFSYLGPSEFYSIHVIRLDLSILRHFQVVQKQLVKVVWRALNFVLNRWFATMAEFFRGKGWFLKLSRVSILHSIMQYAYFLSSGIKYIAINLLNVWFEIFSVQSFPSDFLLLFIAWSIYCLVNYYHQNAQSQCEMSIISRVSINFFLFENK